MAKMNYEIKVTELEPIKRMLEVLALNWQDLPPVVRNDVMDCLKQCEPESGEDKES